MNYGNLNNTWIKDYTTLSQKAVYIYANANYLICTGNGLGLYTITLGIRFFTSG